VRRAVHVRFGSQATADDVLADVPELERLTSVVYPGLAPAFSPRAGARPPPIPASTGSTDPRDNAAAAIEACLLADVELVVGGEAGSAASPTRS
jgi:hypothetical protein